MSLTTTSGASDADSYATLVEASDYITNQRPSPSNPWAATWLASGTTDAIREAAMRQAASLLDGSFTWTGSATGDDQALAWPRTGMSNQNGRAIADDAIPQRLKFAQIEFAGQLLLADRVADLDSEKQGLSSVKAGSVSVSFQSKNSSSVEVMDAEMRKMGPEYDWLSRQVPDAVRNYLVPTWYTRPPLQRKAMLMSFR